MLTIARLARNPPLAVGTLQRRTSQKLLRPFPHGLRTSGRNMSPLPFWLSGAQSVALNMSNNDLPLHLHFALFKGSDGFVLKPPEMLAAPLKSDWEAAPTLARVASEMLFNQKKGSSRGSHGWKVVRREVANISRRSHDDLSDETAYQSTEAFWPPPHETLNRTTIEVISIHNMPKVSQKPPSIVCSRRPSVPLVYRSLTPPAPALLPDSVASGAHASTAHVVRATIMPPS